MGHRYRAGHGEPCRLAPPRSLGTIREGRPSIRAPIARDALHKGVRMFTSTERRRQSLTWVSRGQATEKGRIYQMEPAELRDLAEAQLNAKARGALSSRGGDESRGIDHEQEVQQIELEMQNAELRLARDEVDAALEQYRDLYDFAPVGYLTFDHDGAIRAANLTGATLLGIDRSRLLGRRFGQLVADEARPAFSEFLGKVFGGAAKVACELPLQNLGKLPLFVQIEAVADASGQLCRAVIIDISGRREREEDFEIMHTELAARAARLEEANFELEAFNYTVSHELCSPLTTINGFSEVVLRACKDQINEQSMSHLQGIYAGGMRMKRLTASLLDFSRIDHVGIDRQTVDLSEIAEAVAAELRAAEPESRVDFRAAEGITGNGDAGLCRIVLENLIGNAWKYADNRVGTVIEFGMTELAGKPVFFVCDNGPGFDMAHAGKLFIPFQRIPGMDAGGHGIGLATVKRIVRRHGGRVWAESSPGDGATFFYTLE
jgi:PAS domain S-box-containing protein